MAGFKRSLQALMHFGLRLFGKSGSQYDFGALDVPRLKAKAKELEESQKGMKKKVNTKVINMIDR